MRFRSTLDRNVGLLIVLLGVSQAIVTIVAVEISTLRKPYLLGAFPIVIGVVLIVIGYRIRINVEAPDIGLVFNRWSIMGFSGILVLTVYFTIIAEFVPPANQVPRPFALLVTVGSGTLYGILLGVYIRRTKIQHSQLEAQSKELKQRIDQLDNFAGIVAHDLRNPLAVANGHLEMVREENQSDHLDKVANAHAQMETLIEELLFLVRNSDEVDETEPVDLTELTAQSWGSIATRRADLTINTAAVIQASPTLLEQLLTNLLRNAIEHGGDDVSVTIGDLEDGFFVEDDGPGIPAEKRENVFESGYTSNEAGTGLGLQIVKQVLEVHKWSVDVTDGSDGGARFEITGVETTQ